MSTKKHRPGKKAAGRLILPSPRVTSLRIARNLTPIPFHPVNMAMTESLLYQMVLSRSVWLTFSARRRLRRLSLKPSLTSLKMVRRFCAITLIQARLPICGK
jgi:hypothetical protein